MSRINWRSHRTISIILGLFALYLTVRIKKCEYQTFVFLPNTRPSAVWEFVADFSNMKYLNPTIINFNIIDEGGNYDHWKYSVEYLEHLSHWPYLENNAIAHYNIKASSNKDTYYIISSHKTCFFVGLFCLDTRSEFHFKQDNSSKGSICEELVFYQCPAILSSFCKREVIFQRNAIMRNLKKYFSKNLA